MKRKETLEQITEDQYIISALGALSLASLFHLGGKPEIDLWDLVSVCFFIAAIPIIAITMVMIKRSEVKGSKVHPPRLMVNVGILFAAGGFIFLVLGISWALGGPVFALSMWFVNWQMDIYDRKLEEEKAKITESENESDKVENSES